LRSILTEPKNALIKQYQKLFLMDEVDQSLTKHFVVDKALSIN
jgi:ATP-dependent Clp protease ATP-binding subunit ClpX